METPAPGIYRLMESRIEGNSAIDEVIAAATRQLRVFDISAVALHERDFGRPDRMEAIRKMLLADRAHRLHIVLHDVSRIETELPRLINLLGQFSGQVAVHRSVGVALEAKDPMVIGDDAHFWRKLYYDHPRSALNLHDAAATVPIAERFEQIWESSELALSGGTLGL